MKNSSVYEVYENIMELINNLSKVKDVDSDESLIKILKNVLNKIYSIAEAGKINDICIEIDKVKSHLQGDSGETQYSELMNCLLKCKGYLGKFILGRSNVLIFTKDNAEYELLDEMIKEHGYNVKIKDDNVIENINSYNPEVIVIDSTNMDNSITILNMIKDERTLSSIPIIMVGIEDREKKINALSAGVIDYVSKPFDNEELFYRVRNISNFNKNRIKSNIYDTFTGVYTEQHGKNMAEKQFELIKLKGGFMSVMVVDMDNMAEINVSQGDTVGNKILKESVEVFSRNMKPIDFMYRSHGDGFVMIILDNEPYEVLKLAEEMEKEINAIGNKYEVVTSFSGGISYFSKDVENVDALMEEAIDKLKKAKLSGKNKIYIKSSQVSNYRKPSILMVDDDKIILSILSTRYKNKGYEVNTMLDAGEALEFFKRTPVDLIITDFYMPRMAGDEFIKKIREVNHKVKIIVLSGQKNEEFIRRAMELGADDYVTKPFSPVELDLRVKRLMR